MSKFLERMDKEKMLAPMITGDALDSMPDDPVVQDATDMLQTWRNIYMGGNYFNTNELIKDKAFQNVVISLERIFHNRFGLNIKLNLISNNKSVASATTITPLEENVIKSNTEKIYNAFKHYLDKRTPAAGKDLPMDTDNLKKEVLVVSSPSDVAYYYKNSVEAIEKQLKFKGIKVDTKKGKFIGLDKEIVSIVSLDYVQLIKDWQCTDREILAVIMHEIGHLYLGLAYSYRIYKTNLILTDSLIDEIHNKGKSPKGALTIAYKKATGEDLPKEVLNTKDEVAYIEALDLMYKYQNKAYGSVISYTNNEALADQFASRFGLGHELVTFVARATHYQRDVARWVMIPGILMFSACTAAAVGFGTGLGFWFFASLAVMFGNNLIKFYNKVLDPSRNDDVIKHRDDVDRRIERLRHDIVRQLRTSNHTKEQIEKYVTTYDSMVAILQNIPIPRDKLLDKIAAILFSSVNYRKKTVELEHLVESLTENELHISAAKFKTL